MRGDEAEDLLRPTLAGRREQTRHRPWNVGSQVYVAFFGGVLAVTAIALLNARRLQMSARATLGIAACGMAGIAGVVAVALSVDDNVRVLSRIVALAAYGGMWLLQRGPERIHLYHSRHDEPHASLWIPGLAAVVAGGLAQAGLVYSLQGEAG